MFVDFVPFAIYHIETRPSEGGRGVIVNTEHRRDLFGRDWYARSFVQEYGGGAAVAYDGVVYFSNKADGRVYQMRDGGEPAPITPGNTVTVLELGLEH